MSLVVLSGNKFRNWWTISGTTRVTSKVEGGIAICLRRLCPYFLLPVRTLAPSGIFFLRQEAHVPQRKWIPTQLPTSTQSRAGPDLMGSNLSPLQVVGSEMTMWSFGPTRQKERFFREPLGKISLFFRECHEKSGTRCHYSWLWGQLLQQSFYQAEYEAASGKTAELRELQGNGVGTTRPQVHLPQTLKYLWTWVLWVGLCLIL